MIFFFFSTVCLFLSFFFFKQKTAYEMRISDWSSDVCSSDLELAITYLNDKARPFVEPLAREVTAPIFAPCDVSAPGQLEAVFAEIRDRWGRLDFLFHSIAWARKEDLHGRLTDCSAAGFRSEEHTSELQSLLRILYAVFCSKKKNTHIAVLQRQSHPTPITID